jgi:hypothetical protein
MKLKNLTLSRLEDGTQILESADRYYLLSDVRSALNENALSYNEATEEDVLYLIDEGLVESEGAIVNEVRYDWRHIDPITGMPAVKERPEDKIHLMNQLPGRSGEIVFLQNRVNLNSVGNIRYAKKMYYDRSQRCVADSADNISGEGQPFMTYVLPGAGRPQGWLYLDEYTQLTHRRI